MDYLCTTPPELMNTIENVLTLYDASRSKGTMAGEAASLMNPEVGRGRGKPAAACLRCSCSGVRGMGGRKRRGSGEAVGGGEVAASCRAGGGLPPRAYRPVLCRLSPALPPCFWIRTGH